MEEVELEAVDNDEGRGSRLLLGRGRASTYGATPTKLICCILKFHCKNIYLCNINIIEC